MVVLRNEDYRDGKIVQYLDVSTIYTRVYADNFWFNFDVQVVRVGLYIVMPHSQNQHVGYPSATLTVCVPHMAFTISRSLGLCGCVWESTSFLMTTHRLVLQLFSQPL